MNLNIRTTMGDFKFLEIDGNAYTLSNSEYSHLPQIQFITSVLNKNSRLDSKNLNFLVPNLSNAT